MRRRTINNLKIAAVYGSMLFLCFTLRKAPETYAKSQEEVIHTINNARVEESGYTESQTEETEDRTGTFAISRDWDSEDSEILLRIAMAEAEGEGVTGKELVMMVVLNRMQSDEFPGTIREVVFQPNQFTPTEEGGRYWTEEPDGECYEALYNVMKGWDESEGALYFEAASVDGWIDRNCEYLFQEGNHKFFK